MMTVQQTQIHYCTLCNDKGYIQLLLGGSETCVDCHGKSQWLSGSAKKEKKVQIEHVYLRLR